MRELKNSRYVLFYSLGLYNTLLYNYLTINGYR